MRKTTFRALAWGALVAGLATSATWAQIPGLKSVDLGSPTLAGSSTFAGGKYTIVGGGSDIWNSADGGYYAYISVTGDFDYILKCESLEGPDNWSKAELMAREVDEAGLGGPDGGDRHVSTMTTRSGGQNEIALQWRSNARDSGSAWANDIGIVAPLARPSYPNTWLRLERIDSKFWGYSSSDGVTWTQLRGSPYDFLALNGNEADLREGGDMADTLAIGMAVTAHNDGDENGATAVFSGFAEWTPIPIAITTQPPATLAVSANSAVSITVAATGDPVHYQWQLNGTDIPGAASATFQIPIVQVSDGGSYTVKCYGAGAVVTSTPCVLSVTQDVTPPTIAKVTGSGTFDSVTVTFSESVDVSTATYTVPGLTMGTATVVNPTTVQVGTSMQTEGASYTLTLGNVKDVAGNPLTPNTAQFAGYVFALGTVQYGTWENETGGIGTWVDGDAEGNPVKDKLPTTLGYKSLFEANTADEKDNYFGQLKGLFIPPQTGNYVFYMSSDDQGELYLSTDADPANKVLIAREASWSNRRIWLSDAGDADPTNVNNTATRGVDGEWVNRSDQFLDTQWPTGSTITLTAGNKYYIELLFKEGTGGDNGGATYKLASAVDPANGTASAITGSAIGAFVDPNTVAPVITTRPTTVSYNKGDTVEFTVVAQFATSYQWYHNKKAIAGATTTKLTIPNAGVADIGDYYVDVSNAIGTLSSYPDNDSRAIMKGVDLLIEVEDYNYDGGKTLAAASTMPLVADLYKGKDGLPGIDFHNGSPSSATGGDAINGNNLRNGWLDGAVTNASPTGPETGGNLDVVIDNGGGNTERPDYTLANNYKIGWGGLGNWYQYTRDFPPGNYNAVWVGSHELRTADAMGRTLEIVTGDITKTNAATTIVGELTASWTGDWSSNDSIPFLTPGGSTLAEIPLGANTTVRLKISMGDGDNDYLLFYKTGTITTGPTLSSTYVDGVLKLTYTGTLEGSGTINGDFTDVAGAVSPYTVPQSAPQQYFRSHD